MSEKQTLLERTINRNKKGIALVLGLAALGGAVEGPKALANHKDHGPDKVYTVKAHDTEWGIAERAFPGSDPREHIDQIDSQLPHDSAHADHLVQVGDHITLPGDSKIGVPEK